MRRDLDQVLAERAERLSIKEAVLELKRRQADLDDLVVLNTLTTIYVEWVQDEYGIDLSELRLHASLGSGGAVSFDLVITPEQIVEDKWYVCLKTEGFKDWEPQTGDKPLLHHITGGSQRWQGRRKAEESNWNWCQYENLLDAILFAKYGTVTPDLFFQEPEPEPEPDYSDAPF
jgi:hypothetical protein